VVSPVDYNKPYVATSRVRSVSLMVSTHVWHNLRPRDMKLSALHAKPSHMAQGKLRALAGVTGIMQ